MVLIVISEIALKGLQSYFLSELYFYQLDFLIPVILPDLSSFIKTCLEKDVEQLRRFLFIVYKHLFDMDTFEYFIETFLSFKKAFHRNKLKKLKFLKIDFNINCCFSKFFILNRSFLSFISSFFILKLKFYINLPTATCSQTLCILEPILHFHRQLGFL